MTNTEVSQRLTYRELFDAMQVSITPGHVGGVSVAPMVVSEADASFTRLRAMMHGNRGSVPAGTYTGLYRKNGLWMSDTPDERHDHIGFVQNCQDAGAETVLVGGLGLGMVVSALRILPSVRAVTVVEIDPEVIELVGPSLIAQYEVAGKSLEIVRGDAMVPAETFPKGQRWDASWMDIWQHLCTDNLDEMTSMSRRYCRRVGFQGFWGRELLQAQRRRDRRSGW